MRHGSRARTRSRSRSSRSSMPLARSAPASFESCSAISCRIPSHRLSCSGPRSWAPRSSRRPRSPSWALVSRSRIPLGAACCRNRRRNTSAPRHGSWCFLGLPSASWCSAPICWAMRSGTSWTRANAVEDWTERRNKSHRHLASCLSCNAAVRYSDLVAGGVVAKIAAVANLKGGTGKSTIAVNLACQLAAGGAIVALADVILVPALASTADIMATGKALALIRRAREERPDKGPKALLVPSRVDRRTAAGKEIEAVLLEFGEPVAPMVRQRTAFVDCFTAGQWIGAYARNSDAHVDIQTLAAVVRRMLGHVKT